MLDPTAGKTSKNPRDEVTLLRSARDQYFFLKKEAKMTLSYLILTIAVHLRALPLRRDSDWIGALVRFYNKKRGIRVSRTVEEGLERG